MDKAAADYWGWSGELDHQAVGVFANPALGDGHGPAFEKLSEDNCRGSLIYFINYSGHRVVTEEYDLDRITDFQCSLLFVNERVAGSQI
jgi:hypothetical protein